jgi:transcriptional regulator with GAF, ATPase, and Fis domain/tetratricopeptide (TPR) repeat protein
MDPFPDQLERYELIDDLGRGAQSLVRRAMDRATGAVVAIKSSDGNGRAALRREYALLAGLAHPNLVQALDLFDTKDTTYLVQTLAPGAGLREWGDQQDPRDLCRAIGAALRALQFIHSRGVVHRDVKPENLRVDASPIGRLPGVRLIDFGLAATTSEAVVTGTLGYAAPEVLAGGVAGPPADIYSLGAVLFEALFDRLPNPLLDPSAAAIEVPPLGDRPGLAAPLLRELLSDMLHPLAERRPDARRALGALAEVLGQPLQVDADELASAYYPRPPLVGRDDILATLDRLIAEAAGGRATAVQIEGCGKSAVVQAAARMARLRGLQVIGAEGVAAAFTTAANELPAASSEQLVTRVVDLCIERAQRPLLLALDGPELSRLPAGALLRQLVSALPVSLGRCLLVWTGPLPVELDAEAGRRFETLQLEPLPDEQASWLVSRMLHHCDPPTWVPELLRLGRGDPRWIAELVRAQIEAGLPAKMALPVADPRRLAGERLAALDDDALEVLELVAQAPDAVPIPVLLVATGLTPSRWQRVFATLEQRELIAHSTAGVRPASPALQLALRQRVSAASARSLHRELVRAWRRMIAGHPGRDEHLAHHLLYAGEAAEAAPLLHGAAAGEAEIELALAELPPDDPHRLPLLASLARRRRARGDLDGALELAERDAGSQRALLRAELLLDAGQPQRASAELEGARGAGAAYRRLLARTRILLGDFHGATAAAEEGERLLADEPGADPSPSVELAVLAGLAAVYRGDAEGGLTRLRAAEPAATDIDQPLLLARLYNSLGIALQRLGRLDEAEPAYRTCLTQARRSGDLRVAATAALNLGTVAHRLGRWGQALECYRQAGGLAARGGVGTTHVRALANEANLLLTFGELELAGSCLRAAEELGRAIGAATLQGHVELYLAELALIEGRLELAERGLQQAAGRFAEDDRAAADAVALSRCELALAQRRPDLARQTARQLLTRMGADDPDRCHAHLLLGRALLESDDRQAAAEQLERALALAAAGGVERRWECHALLARCYRDDDPEAAEFHAARVERAGVALRDLVPPAHRAAFDRRHARQRAAYPPPGPDGARPGGPTRRDLLRLLELNKELNRRLPLNDLLFQVLDRAIELTGAERGFVLLRDGGELRVGAARNVDRESLRRGVDRFSRSIAERAIREQQPVIAADAMDDERFAERLSVHGLKLRAVLCVPLRAGGVDRGALYLDNRFHRDAFHAGHAALALAFADQAGIALFNAGLLHDEAAQREALAEAKAEVEALNHQLQSQVTRQSQQLSEVSERLRTHEEELVRRYNAAQIVGRSKPMRELFLQIDRVTDSERPVVIHGESGTGKELVARAIHYMSPRAAAPFVTVNCAAVPESLLGSELFGHVRGAFTGALRDRAGLFEAAGEGTLLLDEVGDMSAKMQARLLRVLQEGTYRRVGDSRERRSRCRVLAASHQRLRELVREGRFREDLYYRLEVVSLTVPPLRARRADIPELVKHFIAAADRQLPLTPAAMAALIDFDWPGNVRQLENELHRALLLAEGNIDLRDLSPGLRATARRRVRATRRLEEGLSQAVQDYERGLIAQALDRSGHNVTQTAQELRLHRVALHRKIRKYGLDRAAAQ